MDIKDKHLINENTVLVTGEYNDRGELWSRVFEGEDTFLVRKTPIALIEETLLHLGSDFLGARRSSKDLLPQMKMYPISINPKMGIILYPTKNIKRHSCVWFSLTHVKSTKRVGIKLTEVFTSYGHTILIDMTERAFTARHNHAIKLQEKISKNLKYPLFFYVEPKKGYYISKQQTSTNFILKKK